MVVMVPHACQAALYLAARFTGMSCKRSLSPNFSSHRIRMGRLHATAHTLAEAQPCNMQST